MLWKVQNNAKQTPLQQSFFRKVAKLQDHH